MEQSMTKLTRPIERMIGPLDGRSFVVRMDEDGTLRIRPKYGRARTVKRFTVRELWIGQREFGF